MWRDKGPVQCLERGVDSVSVGFRLPVCVLWSLVPSSALVHWVGRFLSSLLGLMDQKQAGTM